MESADKGNTFLQHVKKELFANGRFTQDSSILPEVWFNYADVADNNPHNKRVDILLTPFDGEDVSKLTVRLLQLGLKDSEIACITGFVALKATFEELLEKVLPLTDWWGTYASHTSSLKKWEWIQKVTNDFFGVSPTPPAPEGNLIWQIGLNRKAELALYNSAPTVKADAAVQLFNISCQNIGWAVVDSGIDESHPAFADGNSSGSRIVCRYDFTGIREKLDAAKAKDIQVGRVIDWSSLEESLTQKKQSVTDEESRKEMNGLKHGTHVAGIIGASAQPEGPAGICPDIKIYDLRVFDADGNSDEFTILAALQFIRYLNDQVDVPLINGANLSFSIRHNVKDFACGATPVCRECDKLVSSGVVVVAAAGNNGYDDGRDIALAGQAGYGAGAYNDISITDPGNAETVITVGSTHRQMPHSYGVSYFSGRGPTGDGRQKPDLVAPGEKITSTIPGSEYDLMEGTSMAAPHVSGAAALLLARYPEFMGKPQKVKDILLRTATDLKREKYFQGAGLVDALRALQSV